MASAWDAVTTVGLRSAVSHSSPMTAAIPARFLLAENRWQAQRHGTNAQLIDFGRNETAAFPEMIEELIELILPDAVHFDCVSDVNYLREIAARGTSAERQLELAGDIPEDGHLPQDTLDRIVDLLISETQRGL